MCTNIAIPRLHPQAGQSLRGLEVVRCHDLVRLEPWHSPSRGDVEEHPAGEDPGPHRVDAVGREPSVGDDLVLTPTVVAHAVEEYVPNRIQMRSRTVDLEMDTIMHRVRELSLSVHDMPGRTRIELPLHGIDITSERDANTLDHQSGGSAALIRCDQVQGAQLIVLSPAPRSSIWRTPPATQLEWSPEEA